MLDANLRLPLALWTNSGQSLETAVHLERRQLKEAPGSHNRLLSRANALRGHLDIPVALLKRRTTAFSLETQQTFPCIKSLLQLC